MTEIVPRWEWRWFGRGLGPAESRLQALTPIGVQESDETYLLSGAGQKKEASMAAAFSMRAG